MRMLTISVADQPEMLYAIGGLPIGEGGRIERIIDATRELNRQLTAAGFDVKAGIEVYRSVNSFKILFMQEETKYVRAKLNRG